MATLLETHDDAARRHFCCISRTFSYASRGTRDLVCPILLQKYYYTQSHASSLLDAQAALFRIFYLLCALATIIGTEYPTRRTLPFYDTTSKIMQDQRAAFRMQESSSNLQHRQVLTLIGFVCGHRLYM